MSTQQKTLPEVQDEIAREQMYYDWDTMIRSFVRNNLMGAIHDAYRKVCQRAQREALEKQRKDFEDIINQALNGQNALAFLNETDIEQFIIK